MFSTTRNTICVFFVFGLVPFVFSIKCWSCRSDYDPKCADPFENSTIPIVNCDREEGLPHLPGVKVSVCQKMKQKVNGIQVISRGCTWKRPDNKNNTCPTTSNGPKEVTTFCETCDNKDGCNGASTIGKTIALLLAPLSLLQVI